MKKWEILIAITFSIVFVAVIILWIAPNIHLPTSEEIYNRGHGTIVRIEKVSSFGGLEFDFAYTISLLSGKDVVVTRTFQKLQLYEVGDFVEVFEGRIYLVNSVQSQDSLETQENMAKLGEISN